MLFCEMINCLLKILFYFVLTRVYELLVLIIVLTFTLNIV